MKIKPAISVVIPNYNYAHFLGECMQSVIDQTFTDWEMIVVD
ncbi:glycosyltransferase, partial [bacterium]|nr:glycosyltransferase [bacterium]